jgi:hypothetical protein
VTSSAARRARIALEKLQQKLSREIIILEFTYEPPGLLTFFGPVLETDLTIAESHRAALEAAGAAIPAPVRCRFLLDTGADGTVVKHEFAIRAGLKLISDSHPLHGIGVDASGKAYLGRIVFSCKSRIDPNSVQHVFVDTQIASGTLQSDQIDGLIGRDVLQHFELTYNGRTGTVRMRFYRPGTPA